MHWPNAQMNCRFRPQTADSACIGLHRCWHQLNSITFRLVTCTIMMVSATPYWANGMVDCSTGTADLQTLLHTPPFCITLGPATQDWSQDIHMCMIINVLRLHFLSAGKSSIHVGAVGGHPPV